MEPRRVPKHPILHRSPLCAFLDRFWVPFGSHFWHRFCHFWGTFFCVFLGTLKNTFSDSWGYQNGAILEVFFWHLFRMGPKSIFEDPYIENTAFSLPRAAQNESKNGAKTGYPKRYPKSDENGTKSDSQRIPKIEQKGQIKGTYVKYGVWVPSGAPFWRVFGARFGTFFDDLWLQFFLYFWVVC